MSTEPTPNRAETQQGASLRLHDPDGMADGHFIREGDVFGFKTRGFWSAAIRLRTESRFSHVGFAIKIRGRQCVLEAREKVGVRLFPLSRYQSDSSTEVWWFRLRAEEFGINRNRLVSEALESWGDAYASPWQFLRSFGFVTPELADKLGIPAIVNRQRFFCSDYVLAKLRMQGYRGDSRLSAIKASPGDVTELACLEGMGRLKWDAAQLVLPERAAKGA